MCEFRKTRRERWQVNSKLSYAHLVEILKVYFKTILARHWWFTPAILATQEADIRRIMVRNQPGEIVCETLSWKKSITKNGWWSGSRYRPWVQASVLKKKFCIKIGKNVFVERSLFLWNSFSFLFFFFFGSTGVRTQGLRASPLLGRCSITSVTPPAHFFGMLQPVHRKHN
jgi:hypothetical protein